MEKEKNYNVILITRICCAKFLVLPKKNIKFFCWWILVDDDIDDHFGDH